MYTLTLLRIRRKVRKKMYNQEHIMSILNVMNTDGEIKRLLTWFVVNVNLDNKLNLTDINVYAENFIIPVMNLVLDCNLQNMNTYDDQNYPGIDLGDKKAKIAVQVTSSTVRKKIDHTIEKFEGRNEHENYEKLYVAALSHEKPKYKDFKTNGKYEFKPANVLSVNEILQEIMKLQEADKVRILNDIRKQLNIPQDSEVNLTVEDFLVNKFFEQIVELAKDSEEIGDYVEKAIAVNADLDEKRERFEKYWNYIEECYRDVIQLQQQKLFAKAFERLDTSERIQLQKFLKRESEKALLITDNPVQALEAVKKDIIARASISLLSESQVENYLYYQLYMCKLLPNPSKGVYA